MLPRKVHGMLCPRLQIDIAQHSVQLGLCGIRQHWTKLWHDKALERFVQKNAKGGNFWKTVKEILKIILLFLELDILWLYDI